MSSATEPNPDSPRAGRGGTHFHNPDCTCNPCTARRRTEEALAESAGDGGAALVAMDGEAQVEADIIVPPVWRQHKNHAGSRAIIAEWLKLRALEPDITIKAASAKLGIHRSTLHAIINRGTKAGWLRFDDPLSRIEHQIIPKVLDNLNHFLDARDKTVTIETAKGTVFKTFQESKGITEGNNTVLALKIELPPGVSETKVAMGSISGKPKIIIDEVTDDAL